MKAIVKLLMLLIKLYGIIFYYWLAEKSTKRKNKYQCSEKNTQSSQADYFYSATRLLNFF